jgi:acyl-CoA thioester hydrolase
MPESYYRSDYPFAFPFRVRYAETDAQGIVFYGNYLTYFDVAIYEYFRWLCYSITDHVAETGADFHTVRAAVDFHAPSRFDDEIEVCVRTAKIGRSSLAFELALFSGDEPRPRVTGEIVWVNADQEVHRSTPLPKRLVDLLMPHHQVHPA